MNAYNKSRTVPAGAKFKWCLEAADVLFPLAVCSDWMETTSLFQVRGAYSACNLLQVALENDYCD
jgi:hypothetical protein